MDRLLKDRFTNSPTESGGYLVAIVAAVASAGIGQVQFLVGANEVSASFEYVAYPTSLAREILDGDLKNLPLGERTFVTACRAGLLVGAPRIDYESWSGSAGERWRIGPEAVKTESLSKSPWKDGRRGSRLIVRFRTGLNRELFRVTGSGSYQHQGGVLKMIERAKLGGVHIVVDGKDFHESLPIGKGILKLTFSPKNNSSLKIVVPEVESWAPREREIASNGAYWAQFLFGAEEASSRLICRGLSFPVELPLADELGFSGVVAVNDLALNRELSEVKENTEYDDLLNDVESDLLRAAAELAGVIEELSEDDLDKVLDTLDLVIETHRSAGDLDDAISILQRLTGVDKLPANRKASYLTELGMLLARVERPEESLEVFKQSLDTWDEVDEDERDSELLAKSLLGAAQQVSALAEEPREAIEYARRAFDLRRLATEEYDVDRGVAAELLARLYLRYSSYPEAEFMQCEALLNEALLSFEHNYGKSHAMVPNILLSLGEFYSRLGTFTEAEKYFLRALSIQEKLSGSKSQLVAEIFDRLGAVFETEGDIVKAGQYYGRALEIWENILDPRDEEVVRRINDLVVLYRVYGRFTEAEPLYLKLIGLRQGDSEKPSMEAVSDLCALALFYQVQSRFQQAEPLFLKALAALEEHYGVDSEHPDLSWVHGLLGRFYADQYRFKKAEEHLLKSLHMIEKVLGDEHPDLIVSLQALSRYYRIQKRFLEAMECSERALSITEKFYGTQHPYVATALNSYAELLSASGDEDAATPVYFAAFELHEGSNFALSRSKEIPLLSESRLTKVRQEALLLHQKASALASEYSNFAEAESLYLHALFLREQILGADHFDNALTLDLLASLYIKHRRYEGGESLYRRALQVRQSHLGLSHPDCGLSWSILTETLLLQNKFEAAEPLLQEWLAMVQRTLGQHHSQRAEILVRLAKCAEFKGSTEEQKDLLQQAVTIRHEVFGTEHPTFAVTLAEMLRVEDKPEQAAELYDFVLTSLEKNLEQEDPLLIPILENYAKVLNASGRADEAAALETRAMIMRAEFGLDFG